MSKLSRAKRLLLAASMLGSVAVLAIAAVVFAGRADSQATRHRPRQAVAASMSSPRPAPSPSPESSPSPSPSPSAAAPEVPVDVPAPAPARGAIVQIGTMEIPKIGLNHPIFEGVDLRVVDHGPGHWPGTAMPGEYGNVVFAGHRVTHSHPFLHIDQLAPGDQVIFHTANGTSVYEVTEHMIVRPNDVWIAKPIAGFIVTFFGCHPPHSAAQRYVVRAKLIAHGPN